MILPNICYIGGGGELAYWLELKSYFQASEVIFPILLLRNSALFLSEKQRRKAGKLNLEIPELFLAQNTLINKKIRQISNIDIDFTPQREHLIRQFEALRDLARETDPSFLGAVKAQEAKQLKAEGSCKPSGRPSECTLSRAGPARTQPKLCGALSGIGGCLGAHASGGPGCP